MTQTKIKVRTEYHPVLLRTRPALKMDEEQFFEFCQLNREWRIERSAEGELEVMVRVLENLEKVSGDPALPGFVLDLRPNRAPGF